MAIGKYRHVVTLQSPTTAPDGDGGYTETWVDLAPVWNCDIRPATARDLERAAAGTVVATATHIVEGWYRADVKIDGRFAYKGATYRITGVQNVDLRGITLKLYALEAL